MSNITTLKGIEKGRADYAFKCAKAGSELDKKNKVDKAYKAYVKKIPMLIKSNGLGATYSFIFSKKKDKPKKSAYAYHLIYEQTDKWLRKEKKSWFNNLSGEGDIAEALIKLDSQSYRAVTLELIALFTWLRRFAEGLIAEDDENMDD